MREFTERDKAAIISGIPEAYLVLYCPGLQGLGGTLLDRSTNANHATITGASWKRLPRGLYVLDFDGNTNLVNLGSPSYYDDLGTVSDGYPFTLEAWVNPDTLGGSSTGRIIDKGKFLFYTAATQRAIFAINVGAAAKAAGAANNSVPFGTWTHVVGVFDGTNVLIYTNTTKVTGDATAGPVDNHDTYSLAIGNTATATRGFDGKLALPRVYSRALDATEITRHYNRERHLFGV